MIAVEDFMIPCLNKTLLGLECMGCGGQRALFALLRADFVAAFKFYPAIYTLIILGIFLLLSQFYKVKYSEKIKLILVIINIAIILGNFLIKLNTNQL